MQVKKLKASSNWGKRTCSRAELLDNIICEFCKNPVKQRALQCACHAMLFDNPSVYQYIPVNTSFYILVHSFLGPRGPLRVPSIPDSRLLHSTPKIIYY